MAAPSRVALPQLPLTVHKGAQLGNHKRRAGWYQARATWPRPDMAPGVRAQALAKAARLRPATRQVARAAPWSLAGPTNIGGRVTALMTHPNDPSRLWLGAANGGVWTTPDGGKTWSALWEQQDSLAIGALALNPANPKILYAATGEANGSADSYPGVGLYRSVDGGQAWSLWADSRATSIPSRIGALAVDPDDPRRIWLGGMDFDAAGPQGLYRSLDAGKTWTRLKIGVLEDCWCRSIALDPEDSDTLLVGVTVRSAFDGIYRSRDGGETWEYLARGLPPGDKMDRIALAIAPSDRRVVYAQISDMRSGHLGVFRSADGGDQWVDVSGGAFAAERQVKYNNAVVVHPENPNWVLAGAVDLHLSQDGGTSWRQVTDWRAERGAPNYAHADQHALVMPSAAPGLVYAGNDGGLDVSRDGGLSWTTRSRGLAITMFYDLDVAQTDARFFGGGCQDNGTNVTVDGKPDAFFDITGGDGGWMIIDPADPNHIIASIYNGWIFRFDGRRWQDIRLPLSEAEAARIWMVFIAMDPRDSSTLVTGSFRVWRTRDAGQNWEAVSDVLDGSPVSAVSIAPSDSRRLYVGTEKGAIFRSDDGGDSWTDNLVGNDIPEFLISELAVHPSDPDTVYTAIANSGHSHVFRSRDAGLQWEDLDRGRLPDIAHNALVIHPDDPARLFVGNDAGVFASANGGGTWENLSFNLPRVPVTDLTMHRQSLTLFAATYGRSIYRLTLTALPTERARPSPPPRRARSGRPPRRRRRGARR